ncbi:PP-loop family [seawater metagenome]|uniref:tRNA(Ile)-lysidine synthetase n=1 Tax=seawater metagenome TaxID=1561972 RepID=A0A5E8CLZ6_9ZZZZ
MDKIKKELKNNKINNCKILIAVSGGPDSIFLLHNLNKLKKKLNLKLYVGHVNHSTRETCLRDQTFVQNICQELEIECIIKTCPKKENLSEEEARNYRYKFLTDIKNKKLCNYIVLGHNEDDQVETILMKIFKGCSVQGISGMTTISQNFVDKSWTLLRPMLKIKKDLILNYLNKNNIRYCFDETNLDIKYTRNYLRNILIPQIKEYINPQVNSSILNFNYHINQSNKIINTELQKKSKKLLGEYDGKIQINYKYFFLLKKSNSYQLSIIIRNLFTKLKIPRKKITKKKIDNFIELLSSKNKEELYKIFKVSIQFNNDDLVIKIP